MKTKRDVPAKSGQGTDAVKTPCPFEPFECVAIVGVGLMGGSLGMALRKAGLAGHVLGIDVRPEILEKAAAAGAIDTGSAFLNAAAASDCVVFAAPVSILGALMETGAAFFRPDALITDLGSVKTRIVETGERLFGRRFIGGHPMSGSAESGIEAARSDLFEGAAWAVVRSVEVSLESDESAARIAAMITALGGRPIPLTASEHDHLAALVSHLPHLLSFAFARTVKGDANVEQAREMAGGSFRDLIRVSASDTALWRDIFLDNRAALQDAIASYESHLELLKQAIEGNDSTDLLRYLRNPG